MSVIAMNETGGKADSVFRSVFLMVDLLGGKKLPLIRGRSKI